MSYTPWTTRKVGIEMEMLYEGRARGTRLNTTRVADAMRAAFAEASLDGTTIRDCQGGWSNSTGGRTWDVKTDASCGLEIASRALTFNESGHNEELRAACTTLTRLGKVDSRCGLHVHVDVSDFSRADFQRLLSLWYRYEPFFYSMVAPSRGTNHYCAPVRSTSWVENTTRGWNESAARRALTATSDVAMQRALSELGHWGQKYRGMNIAPYPMGGRVEFRLHHGTLSYAKIRAWVLWLTSLVNRAKATHVSPVKREVPTPLDVNARSARNGLGFNARYMAYALGLRGRRTDEMFASASLVDEMTTWSDTRRRDLHERGAA